MTPARNRADRDRRTIGDERSTKPRRRVDRRAKLIERLSVAIAVACFSLGWYSLQRQANNINETAAVSRRTAIDSKRTATRLAAFVRDIQAQRRSNIRANCEDQNARHDRTIRRLDAIAGARHVPRARIQPTIHLIDALAPHHDCARLVLKQTGAR